ncbi:nuclease-related domain-containing protein [Neobacillus sp. K501]
MAFKNRTEPKKLKILRSLNTRKELNPEEKRYYLSQEKGYEGEVKFDLMTEKLESGLLILNDLLLSVNHTKFQIDSMIISPEKLYPCEVKNFEGDYEDKSGRLHIKNGPEIKDPLKQVERSESLLRQYLQKIGYSFPIEPYLVYVNPEFTLYQAPLNDTIIFPTQINRLMKKFNLLPGKVNERQRRLAQRFVADHIIESPYDQIQPYNYGELCNGMTCSKCHSFSVSYGGKYLVCSNCGCVEKIEDAVVRSVEELKLLFPDMRITTKLVYEWCKIFSSKRMISRILKLHYSAVGMKNHRYYE